MKHSKTVLYTRVSSSDQNPDRQLTDKDGYEFVLIDCCKSSIQIFDREKGKLLKVMIKEGAINEIHIHAIDRAARNLESLLRFINFCHSFGVSLFIKNLGLRTLDEKGKPSYVVKMIISMVGAFAEVENEIRRERQLEGIEIAKIKGRYKNRTPRGKETPAAFLKKHSKAVEYLKMGMKGSEVIRLLDGNLNKNTITKIKKYMKKNSKNLSIEIMEKRKVQDMKEKDVYKEISSFEYVDLKTAFWD
ncbi:MAG: recombinase family protein [Flavobacteriaceae bacterium]